jgi:hypothetical protein
MDPKSGGRCVWGGLARLPVRSLDGSGIPDRFKYRHRGVAGEAVPLSAPAEIARLEAAILRFLAGDL